MNLNTVQTAMLKRAAANSAVTETPDDKAEFIVKGPQSPPEGTKIRVGKGVNPMLAIRLKYALEQGMRLGDAITFATAGNVSA